MYHFIQTGELECKSFSPVAVPFIPVVIPLAIDRDFMVSFREDNPDEIRL